MSLPYDQVDWSINYRKHPDQYIVSRGQFGVLKYEPYKSEILQYWKYADKESAKQSKETILGMFYEYLSDDDFVGADMSKKFLHMGFTRAMRYAKYPAGKKYNDDGSEKQAHAPDTTGWWADASKRAAALQFKPAWDEARNNEKYQRLKELHKSGELYDQHTLGEWSDD